jgi:hypothetical protein
MNDDVNDKNTVRIAALKLLRALLRELESGAQLPAPLFERVRDARLRTDREIEALRMVDADV